MFGAGGGALNMSELGAGEAGMSASGAGTASAAAGGNTLLDFAHQTVTGTPAGTGLTAAPGTAEVLGAGGTSTTGAYSSALGSGVTPGAAATGSGLGVTPAISNAAGWGGATGATSAAGTGGGTLFGLTGTDLMRGAGSFLTQQFMANQAQRRAQEAARLSNPLDDPRRAGFQTMATNAAANPLNNPFASQYLKMGQNMLDAGAAKSGNTTNIAAGVIPQVMTGMSQDYNQWLNTLMMGGGFNQGPGYAGTNYAALSGQGLGYQNQSMYGLGDIAKKVFGTPQRPQQQAANAITGSSIEMGG
jgi:hypothetical protein